MPRSWKCWAFSRRRDWMANHWGIPYGHWGGSRTFLVRRIIRCALDGLLCGPSERKASSLSRRRSRNLTICFRPNELQNHYVPWDPRVQKLRKILAELSAKSPHSQKVRPQPYPRAPAMNCTRSGIWVSATLEALGMFRAIVGCPIPRTRLKNRIVAHGDDGVGGRGNG